MFWKGVDENMNYTTYQNQVNILNDGLIKLINSPAMRNAISIRNDISAITNPILEMNRQIKKINQPLSGMMNAINAIQSVAGRFSEYNVEISQIVKNISVLEINNLQLQNIRTALETISRYQNLYDTLDAVPNTFYDKVLENTEYNKNDILDNVDEFVGFVDELKENNDTAKNIVKVIDQKKEEFFSSHPVFYILCIIITVLCNILNCKNELLPIVQESIVCMEGNEDIYFTKTNVAKVYEQPNCKSKTVGKLLYGESMKKVEDINMWIKVIFTDTEGNEYTGWVAKRNLIDYKTWKYNSDSLYE